MTKGDLFSEPYQGEPPHVAHSVTSRESAEQIKPTAAALRARVLQFIKSCGSSGATDEEIQIALSMDGNTQRPRRWELSEKTKEIVPSGKFRSNRSGRRAVVWVVA